MILSPAVLSREHGAGATSIDRVLARGGAAGDSVSHPFPGGRVQLMGEAVAVQTNDEAPRFARSAAEVFARRQGAPAALFVRHGPTGERGRRLGAFIAAAAEGPVIVCRAEQSTAPIERAAAEIHDLLLHALRGRPGAEPRPRS